MNCSRDGRRQDRLSGELCGALVRCLLLRIRAHRVGAQPEDAESFATFKRCSAYLEAHFRRLNSLQQAAHECNVDPAYLCRLFKRHARQTPYQYLTRMRMNHAADRLLDQSLTVAEVALEFGYTDPFHFSRTFKGTLGIAPTKFRTLR